MHDFYFYSTDLGAPQGLVRPCACSRVSPQPCQKLSTSWATQGGSYCWRFKPVMCGTTDSTDYRIQLALTYISICISGATAHQFGFACGAKFDRSRPISSIRSLDRWMQRCNVVTQPRSLPGKWRRHGLARAGVWHSISDDRRVSYRDSAERRHIGAPGRVWVVRYRGLTRLIANYRVCHILMLSRSRTHG